VLDEAGLLRLLAGEVDQKTANGQLFLQ